jgi:hypothetical protein
MDTKGRNWMLLLAVLFAAVIGVCNIVTNLPPLVVLDALTDGSVVIGNAGHALCNDVPIRLEVLSEVQARHSHIDNVNALSVDEGDCDESLTCVESTDGIDATTGRCMWSTLERVE